VLRRTGYPLGHRTPPADRHPHLTAQFEGSARQRAQGGLLLGEARLPGQVALPHELLEKPTIGSPIGEIPAAAHPQRLVDCLLEAEVGLLDVAVFVRDPEIVGRRFPAIVGHEGGIARRCLAPAVPIERAHRGAEVIGAMLARHPADLPETDCDPLRQRFETLREHQMHRFDIRIHQDEMKEQMREGNPGEGDAQIGQVREVRLGDDPRLMDLGEKHFLRRPVVRPPGGDLALERAHLGGLILLRPPFAEQREQRRRLQGRVAPQLLLHPRPVVGERIGSRAIAAWRRQVARQFAAVFVAAHRADAHARPRGGLLLGLALGPFSEHDPYLPVGFHDALLWGRHARSRAAVGQASRSI
jgi:hypothetical protein